MSARVTACVCVHACVHEYAHKDIVTLTSVVEGLAAKCLDACITCARKLDARAELSAQSMYRLMFICGLKCDHDDKDSGQRAHAVDFVNRLSALGIAVVDRLLAKGQRTASDSETPQWRSESPHSHQVVPTMIMAAGRMPCAKLERPAKCGAQGRSRRSKGDLSGL